MTSGCDLRKGKQLADIEYTKNLAPAAQYQRGDSLTFRASTAVELAALLDEAKGKPELGEFFSPATEGTENVTKVKVLEPSTDTEALENLKNVLGATPVEKPASPAQIAVAAKKSGKSVEELQGISEAAAKALIQKGSE